MWQYGPLELFSSGGGCSEQAIWRHACKEQTIFIISLSVFLYGKMHKQREDSKIKGKKPNAKLLLDGYGVEINGHPTAIPLLSLGTKMVLRQIRILILMTSAQG